MRIQSLLLFTLLWVPVLGSQGPSRPGRSDSGVQTSPALKVTGKVISQAYCYGDNQVFTASMKIGLVFLNTSERPVILSRKMNPPNVTRVAATLAAAKQENFEHQTAGTAAYGHVVEPVFGTRPDPKRFLVLAPGRSYRTEVTSGVIARFGNAGNIPGSVKPGRHFLQLRVDTWPYPTVGPETVQSVKRVWSAFGDLSTGEVWTNFFPFSIPDHVRPVDCSK